MMYWNSFDCTHKMRFGRQQRDNVANVTFRKIFAYFSISSHSCTFKDLFRYSKKYITRLLSMLISPR